MTAAHQHTESVQELPRRPEMISDHCTFVRREVCLTIPQHQNLMSALLCMMQSTADKGLHVSRLVPAVNLQSREEEAEGYRVTWLALWTWQLAIGCDSQDDRGCSQDDVVHEY